MVEPRIALVGWLALVGSSTSCTVEIPAILPPFDEAGDDEAGESESESDEGPVDESGFPDELLDLPEGGEALPPACGLHGRSLDGALPCDLPPPSEVIDPVVAWTWTGPEGETSVVVTPLVANFDDDDESGTVDLCDRPDVLVIAVDLAPAKSAPWPAGHVYVLDGGSGSASQRFEHPVDASITPAVADLDADGELELVAMEAEHEGKLQDHIARRLIVFEHDGSVRALGEWSPPQPGGGAIAIADLDRDGSPELLGPGVVADADAQPRWWASPVQPNTTPVAVDLDLEGELEVLIGGNAYTAEGVEIFDASGIQPNAGTAAVANFDADPFPEIYVQVNSHRILEHDGTVKTNCQGGGGFPVAVDDLDDDGQAEILHAHKNHVSVLEVFGDDDDEKCKVSWSYKVDEADAQSSGTAFDLLGDGEPESIYADRSRIRILSSEGIPLAELPRTARPSIANPIVADVDDDGAADIVVVSSEPISGEQGKAGASTASVIVLRNSDDRFAPARRVWNQHTYHGSNIGEDGHVPIHEPPHWLSDLGFRTNESPNADGAVCQPPAQP
ncbi:FG-GAP repeat domain-containing protein [Nannocystaceae bacterium ST9]